MSRGPTDALPMSCGRCSLTRRFGKHAEGLRC